MIFFWINFRIHWTLSILVAELEQSEYCNQLNEIVWIIFEEFHELFKSWLSLISLISNWMNRATDNTLCEYLELIAIYNSWKSSWIAFNWQDKTNDNCEGRKEVTNDVNKLAWFNNHIEPSQWWFTCSSLFSLSVWHENFSIIHSITFADTSNKRAIEIEASGRKNQMWKSFRLKISAE